jgi:hypothetical protein
MLLGLDVAWLISSIVDIVKTVHFVRECGQYDSIGDFMDCMVTELKESTIGFIALHVFVLFMESLIAWMNFKIGGAE